MREWVLRVELDGEWEECKFPTRNEALSTFAALTEDYERNLQRAILFAPASGLESLQRPHSRSLN